MLIKNFNSIIKALIESNSNFEVSSGACPVSGISRLITFSFLASS